MEQRLLWRFKELSERRWAATAVLFNSTVSPLQDAGVWELNSEHWQLMEDVAPSEMCQYHYACDIKLHPH